MTQYSPLAVSNSFVRKAGEGGISHLKLQKLVYCLHGWWLAYNEEGCAPLVGENPQAWRYGPIFGSLYRQLKGHGIRPINRPAILSPRLDGEGPDDFIREDDERANKLLDWVWGRYEGVGAITLCMLTHRPGTPWHDIAQMCEGRIPHGTEIRPGRIREEFLLIKSGLAPVLEREKRS